LGDDLGGLLLRKRVEHSGRETNQRTPAAFIKSNASGHDCIARSGSTKMSGLIWIGFDQRTGRA
jgi:hypothetical protein